jgi:hypothetical protein
MTLDSATEFLFGESVESQGAAPGSDAHKNGHAQSKMPGRNRLGAWCRFLKDKEFDNLCKIVVHEFCDRYVAKALELRRLGKDEGRYIFLNEMAKTVQDPKQLRNEMLNILLAGRDTTASLLGNTFHALARHPDVWDKLKREVDGLEGRAPSYEDLKNVQYLKWF